MNDYTETTIPRHMEDQVVETCMDKRAKSDIILFNIHQSTFDAPQEKLTGHL